VDVIRSDTAYTVLDVDETLIHSLIGMNMKRAGFSWCERPGSILIGVH